MGVFFCNIKGFAKEPSGYDPATEASGLADKGAQAFARRRFQEALEFYKQRLSKDNVAGDVRAQAMVSFMIGRCYQEIGVFDGAV